MHQAPANKILFEISDMQAFFLSPSRGNGEEEQYIREHLGKENGILLKFRENDKILLIFFMNTDEEKSR